MGPISDIALHGSRMAFGGGGAYITGTLAVTPGEILRLIVGCGGGYANGATAVDAAGGGGGGMWGGGGRSSIQRIFAGEYRDIVVAAGGGGYGGNRHFGGSGGCASGESSPDGYAGGAHDPLTGACAVGLRWLGASTVNPDGYGEGGGGGGWCGGLAESQPTLDMPLEEAAPLGSARHCCKARVLLAQGLTWETPPKRCFGCHPWARQAIPVQGVTAQSCWFPRSLRPLSRLLTLLFQSSPLSLDSSRHHRCNLDARNTRFGVPRGSLAPASRLFICSLHACGPGPKSHSAAPALPARGRCLAAHALHLRTALYRCLVTPCSSVL